MNTIKWSKEELKEIKKIILTRANLKLNENHELVELSKCIAFKNQHRDLYSYLSDELAQFIYMDIDNIYVKKEIEEVLTKASQVKIVPNNNLYYGLLNSLSKIDPENKTDIFIIFKEIIAQYEQSIYNIAKSSLESASSLEEANKKISEIYRSKDITLEERLIKEEINRVFILSNGVTDSVLFTSLIEKLDSLIKPKLISRMNVIIGSMAKAQNFKKEQLNQEYKYRKAAIAYMRKK